MSTPPDTTIFRLISALKAAGLWSGAEPRWVTTWNPSCTPDIWDWVQFVYLPARQSGKGRGLGNLAPQIGPFLKDDPLHEDILRLAVEIDNLRSPKTSLTSDTI
jgi:hypothetical protein